MPIEKLKCIADNHLTTYQCSNFSKNCEYNIVGKINELIDIVNYLTGFADIKKECVQCLLHRNINDDIGCPQCFPESLGCGLRGEIEIMKLNEKKESPKLLPCPFCGSVAIIDFCRQRQAEQYNVMCSNGKCKVLPLTNWFEKEQEAIQAWNRRK